MVDLQRCFLIRHMLLRCTLVVVLCGPLTPINNDQSHNMNSSNALLLVAQFSDTASLGQLDTLNRLSHSVCADILRIRNFHFVPVGYSDSEDERSRTYQRIHRTGRYSRTN